jgi:hypothetical protein
MPILYKIGGLIFQLLCNKIYRFDDKGIFL